MFLKKILNSSWLHTVLLPLVFVLQVTNTFFAYVSFEDSALSFLASFIFSIASYWVLTSLLGKKRAAVSTIISFVGLYIFFNFNNLHQLIVTNFESLNKTAYPELIIMLFFITVVFLIFFGRNNKNYTVLKNVVRYVNVLLLIFLFVEIVGLLKFAIKQPRNKVVATATHPLINKQIESQPNIFLVVFDEYTSSATLKKRLGFSNPIDSILKGNNFQVIENAISNYHVTSYSIASLLNMSPLSSGPEKKIIQKYGDLLPFETITKNRLVQFLKSNGYSIINNSIFDIEGEKTALKPLFFNTGASAFWAQTFLGKRFESINYYLSKILNRKTTLLPSLTTKSIENNSTVYSVLKQQLNSIKDKPTFIYSHFNLPHSPFVYKEDGTIKNYKEHWTGLENDKSYTNNVLQANRVMLDLMTIFFQNKSLTENSIFIIIGDHGYRNPRLIKKEEYFDVFSAIYIPAKYYFQIPEGMSLYNLFRIILIKVFHQELELLPDSISQPAE